MWQTMALGFGIKFFEAATALNAFSFTYSTLTQRRGAWPQVSKGKMKCMGSLTG